VETDVLVRGAVDSNGDPLKAGITDYAVYINDQLLVDNLSANHLICTPREYETNVNDVVGLYNVTWNFADGDEFDLNSSGMDGQLKGLFDIRDGNNMENFKGTVTANEGDTQITVQADKVNTVNRLNISDTGTISIGSYDYDYSDFTINYDANGDIESYTFDLKTPIKKQVNGVTAHVGESVDFKGIPYYQAQLNEFVRTFAQAFNSVFNQGTDEYGNQGLDFFTAVHSVTGEDMVLNEAGDTALNGATVSAKKDSYYRMTAANISINQEISKDSSMFCTRRSTEQGVASCELLKEMIDLKTDNTMFSQGNPAEFLQSVTADISVDCSKAKNFESSLSDVLNSIDNQRSSISGVDTNEELAQLVMYQNAYNLCSKMISVLNQVYDRLISNTGV
jgi:flagellar hook-associated protein 1 FlgK